MKAKQHRADILKLIELGYNSSICVVSIFQFSELTALRRNKVWRITIVKSRCQKCMNCSCWWLLCKVFLILAKFLRYYNNDLLIAKTWTSNNTCLSKTFQSSSWSSGRQCLIPYAKALEGRAKSMSRGDQYNFSFILVKAEYHQNKYDSRDRKFLLSLQ